MKLVHPDFFFPIEFKENQIETIVIEKPEIFSKLLLQFKAHIDKNEDCGWVLSANNKLLDMSKTCEIVLDPFAVDINNRKLQNALLEKLETEISSTEYLFEWNNLCGNIIQTMDIFLSKIDYQVSYSCDLLIKDFLKLMRVRFQEDNVDFFEKLLDFLSLERDVLNIKIFIMINIKSFLSMEQLNFLYQQSCYKKFQLLFLETKADELHKICDEHIVIIDRDSCVIS